MLSNRLEIRIWDALGNINTRKNNNFILILIKKQV